MDESMQSEHFFTQIDEALRCISTFHSQRFRSVNVYIQTIVVGASEGRLAEAIPGTGVCVLTPELLNHSSLAIASVIIHEMTHLRIDRLGARSNSDRAERLCVKHEIDFLEHVQGQSDAEPLLAKRRRKFNALAHTS
jgi:hypothetical protein